MSKTETLTDDEVVSRAERWARLHSNQKLRGRMDAVLEGLTDEDQRRVYLCGQRMVAGLPLKVVPAIERNTNNGKKTNSKQRRKAAVK